ncbi:MAG: phosphatase PAP2 family protein [Planctomycetota bacterium]
MLSGLSTPRRRPSLGALLISCLSGALAPSCRIVPNQEAPAPRPDAESAPPTLWQDLRSVPATVGSDLWSLVSDRDFYLVNGGAYLGTRLVDASGLEGNTERYFESHQVFGSSASDALDTLGLGSTLIGLGTAWYTYATWQEDEAMRQESRYLLRSLAATGLMTIAFKTAFPDERPDASNNQGYPSGHTSMAFTAATSLWQGYGPKVGIPATVLASAVAVQRMDSGAHDLDDIIGGVTLGWFVAKSLHQGGDLKVLGGELSAEAFTPLGTPGLTIAWRW